MDPDDKVVASVDNFLNQMRAQCKSVEIRPRSGARLHQSPPASEGTIRTVTKPQHRQATDEQITWVTVRVGMPSNERNV